MEDLAGAVESQYTVEPCLQSSRSHGRGKLEAMRLAGGVLFSNILNLPGQRVTGPSRCIDSNKGDSNRWGTIGYQIGRKKRGKNQKKCMKKKKKKKRNTA